MNLELIVELFSKVTPVAKSLLKLIFLTFDDKSKNDKKALLEIIHTTVIRVEESAVNKDDLRKIFLCDVPTEMYPEMERKFLEITKSIGYPPIGLEKKINFKELFEKNQK